MKQSDLLDLLTNMQRQIEDLDDRVASGSIISDDSIRGPSAACPLRCRVEATWTTYLKP